MVPWAEPRASSSNDGLNSTFEGKDVFQEIRRFCVIRRKPTYCLCLPINTYSGQATTKPGVVADDHCVIAPAGGTVQLHPREKQLKKSPLFAVVEDTSISINAMSRINFAKVYPVEYNIRVRNIGRLVSDSIRDLDRYFLEAMGFTDESAPTAD